MSSLRDLWERLASKQLALKKGSTATGYHRQRGTILEPLLGNRLVKEVTRSDIERLHKKMRDTAYRANRLLALVSGLMNPAEARVNARERQQPVSTRRAVSRRGARALSTRAESSSSARR